MRRLFRLRNCGIPILLSLCAMSITATIMMLFYSTNFNYLETRVQVEKSMFSIRRFVESVIPKESIFSMDQKDDGLWKHIRDHYLTKPSEKDYNLTSSGQHSNGFSSLVFSLFNQSKTGTFIEAGAYDGEGASNTLFLEEQGWKGILVECNPIILPKLRSKNRKAWISNVCLSVSDTPETLNFTTPIDWPASARLGKPMDDKEMKDVGIDWMKNKTWLEYQIPCMPLYSIIKAVGEFKEIDFLSLDVEGSEIAVLKHFPFEEMTIKVMLVEVFQYTKEEKTELNQFMSTKGYDLINEMAQDYLYALKYFKSSSYML